MISTMCMMLVVWLATTHAVNGKKPYSKREQELWRLECALGVVSDSECPVDGGWSPWSAWSACRGLCDEIGHRSRTRHCNNPAPSREGIPCYGPDEQIEPCFLTNCTVNNFRLLVIGDPARMDAMRQLEATPALMERCLQMQCSFEAIEAALAYDNTWRLQPEALWNSLQCVKNNVGCPVSGVWSTWGEWSTCGARCGRGMRWRLRRCDTPPPSDAHLACVGSPLQAEECDGDQCAFYDAYSNIRGGDWGAWSEWSPCSENCGPGVRRRRRNCLEFKTEIYGKWLTHCRGQHDQLEVCKNKICLLNGGWSGWGPWGPCSQSCGAGKRFRSRSCTRPVPSGNGTPCAGHKTEVGTCNLNPCEVYSRSVLIFNGESSLHYNLLHKRSALFHFYIRFFPLSPHGTLVRRGTIHNPMVRLSIQKWHICLDVSGSSSMCSLPRLCSPLPLEAGVWHSAMVAVTSEVAVLRLDDQPAPLRAEFICDPEFSAEKLNLVIGQKMHGEIQEIILNFIPLSLSIDRDRHQKSSFSPTRTANIAYEEGSLEAAFLNLANDHYMRVPCFNKNDYWQIGIIIQPKCETGTILFINDHKSQSWFSIIIQRMRIKMKCVSHEYRIESGSSSDFSSDKWISIDLTKQTESNTIEAKINGLERLHISFAPDYIRNLFNRTTGPIPVPVICHDEFYVGGVPQHIKNTLPEDFTPFAGILGALTVDQKLQDIHSLAVERYKDGIVQVTSKTASVSGSYHETAWGDSNRLNLTCLPTRYFRSADSAQWLFLDSTMESLLNERKIISSDDGRVLRLVALADNDLRGFYTCRARINKQIRNIITFGVLGKIHYSVGCLDCVTGIAIVTTLTLVLATLAWLFIEGFHDLKTGYGFFRDGHLSPEEEADMVCEYIDKNCQEIGSHSSVRLAKDRARRRARHSRCSAPQQPLLARGNTWRTPQLKEESSQGSVVGSPSPRASLAPVPPSSPEVYRNEPCFVSSPRHGSNLTSPSQLTSSSGAEPASPRLLCSRLLAKRPPSSRHSSRSRRLTGAAPQRRSSLVTIKSSSYLQQSPAFKILQKFSQLKNDDP